MLKRHISLGELLGNPSIYPHRGLMKSEIRYDMLMIVDIDFCFSVATLDGVAVACCTEARTQVAGPMRDWWKPCALVGGTCALDADTALKRT